MFAAGFRKSGVGNGNNTINIKLFYAPVSRSPNRRVLQSHTFIYEIPPSVDTSWLQWPVGMPEGGRRGVELAGKGPSGLTQT